MLTANRFDEIKAFTTSLHHGTKVAELSLGDISKMAVMLSDLAAEIERMRQPAQAAGRGHLKPVILDAQGQAVMPPPLAHQFVAERHAQYDADRLEAIQTPIDTNRWRVFALRWGLPPPPGGWEAKEQITNVIHAIRLGVKAVPYVDKHFSAVYLTSKGIALPHPAKLVAGTLSGVEVPE